MSTVLKKYFVGLLSFFLILSNFSFASTLMFCKMGMDDYTCQCKHNTEKHSGLSISKVKKSCCDLRTKELANNNTLSNLNNGPNPELFSSIINFEFFGGSFTDCHYQFNSVAALKFLIPKTDIPIKVCSLLI